MDNSDFGHIEFDTLRTLEGDAFLIPSEPDPASQAESYWNGLQRARIEVAKRFTCRECEHCRSWRAKAGDGGTVDVGFCTRMDLPLDHSELESSQWDMCGVELFEE